MKFDILTLFPEEIENFLKSSIIGRAQENNIVNINTINIRDYSKDKHKKVDDYPYGGGQGMVMTPQPIFDAYETLSKNTYKKPYCIYMSPQGKKLNQQKVIDLSKMEHIVLLCGHYEGVDERVIENLVDEEISVGDYVLTGGEIPAMVVVDSVCRMIPGVLSSNTSFTDESHYNGLLECPQYTRPQDYEGFIVPDVLMSGHHNNIYKWRNEKSIERTRYKRPDMYYEYMMNKSMKEKLDNMHTNNLMLKLLDEKDAFQITEYYKRNKMFFKHWDPVREKEFYTVEYQRMVLEFEKKQRNNGTGLRYWIYDISDSYFDMPIGTVSLTNITRGCFKSAIVGYRLDKDSVNKGYMTEAINKVVDIAFRKLNLHRLEANIMPENNASIRVIEKCKFKLIGKEPSYLFIKGKWRDHLHYIKINKKYKA